MKYLLKSLAFILNKLPKTDWKPIPLCDVYGRYGLDAPNLVGHTTAPSVTTDATPSSITSSSAVFDTNSITSTGGENASVRGICWVAGAGGTPTTSNSVSSTSGSYSTGTYSSTMTGLSAGTTYSVRAFATNSAGTGYGSTVEVTTLAPPTVTTSAATLITSSSFLGNGEITAIGDATPTTRGVCLVAGTGTPTIADTVFSSSGTYSTGTFSRNATGLNSNTLYTYRAFATSSAGTGYGANVQVTTLANAAPTTTSLYPADGATISGLADYLSAVANDADNDRVDYQLQIDDTSSSFGSVVVDSLSTDSSSGFYFENVFTSTRPYPDDTSFRFYPFIDAHTITGTASYDNLYSGATEGVGQSFTGDGNDVAGLVLPVARVGSPTGNATVNIYAHSGTFATSSVPTGTPLVTKTIDVSTIGSTIFNEVFLFDTPYTTTNGTRYVWTFEYSGGNASNYINVREATTNTSGGNASLYSSSSWSALSLVDFPHIVIRALPADTYYWRVRGIDPSGSNTYGAWSSTRSFEVTAGGNYSGTPGIATLTLTAYTPTVTATDNKSVETASPSALTLTAQTPNAIYGQILTPGIATLTLTAYEPTVAFTDNKSITTASPTALTLTPNTPTVDFTDNKAITLASPTALTITLYEPTATVSSNQTVTPDTASLTTTTHDIGVAVSDNKAVTPGTGSLTITLYEPTVAFTDNKSITTASPSSLTLTPNAPTVDFTDNKSITLASPSELTLTPQTPTVALSDNKQITLATPTELILTAWTPTVALSDNKQATTATPTELILTTHTPGVAVSSGSSLTPGTATLSLTAYEPTVDFTAHVSVTPETASLTTTRLTPTVDFTDNKTATPGTASLSLTPHTPTVDYTYTPIEVTPGVASMLTEMFAPTVAITQNQTITPGTATLRLRSSYPIVNGQVRTRNYYIDSDANIYWVINEELGLVERV